ncbi:MAG: hypothetical protein PHH00_01255 [Candidatus Nanoarchaeia archaeon]|nr:hypothetical protein [Candidatus Nanoarchaeia archaeon]
MADKDDIEQTEREFTEKLGGLGGLLGKRVALTLTALSTFYQGPVPLELTVAVWNDPRIRAIGQGLGENIGAIRDYVDYVSSAIDELGKGYGERVPTERGADFITQVAERVKRYQLGDFQKTRAREKEEGEEDE